MIKRFSLFAISCVLIFTFAGSYDARGLENLSYAVAIGLDKGENNLLRLSLQFPAPNSSGGGNSRKSTIFFNNCNNSRMLIF